MAEPGVSGDEEGVPRQVTHEHCSDRGPDAFPVGAAGDDAGMSDDRYVDLLSRVLSLVGADRLRAAMSSIDSEEAAQRIATRIQSVLPREDAVAAAVGPVLATADLVQWLGVSRQAIHNRVRRNELLALKTSDGHVVYPDWQFDDDGTTRRGVGEAVKALSEAGMDPWTQAAWFRGRSSAFDDRSAAQWLTEGRDPARVAREGRRRSNRWAQ